MKYITKHNLVLTNKDIKNVLLNKSDIEIYNELMQKYKDLFLYIKTKFLSIYQYDHPIYILEDPFDKKYLELKQHEIVIKDQNRFLSNEYVSGKFSFKEFFEKDYFIIFVRPTVLLSFRFFEDSLKYNVEDITDENHIDFALNAFIHENFHESQMEYLRQQSPYSEFLFYTMSEEFRIPYEKRVVELYAIKCGEAYLYNKYTNSNIIKDFYPLLPKIFSTYLENFSKKINSYITNIYIYAFKKVMLEEYIQKNKKVDNEDKLFLEIRNTVEVLKRNKNLHIINDDINILLEDFDIITYTHTQLTIKQNIIIYNAMCKVFQNDIDIQNAFSDEFDNYYNYILSNNTYKYFKKKDQNKFLFKNKILTNDITKLKHMVDKAIQNLKERY